jgi:pSer/pThr/pTyr-binding forkhead associated (FHA) protein
MGAGAGRGVVAFLVFVDDDGFRRTFTIEPGVERVRMGRDPGEGLSLPWDPEISRVHAELERVGSAWVVVDDGLSSNGTHVNDERLCGRRRLNTGDRLRMGSTEIVFRALADEGTMTVIPGLSEPPVELSPGQRKVLIALARPYRAGNFLATPATNQEIAAELHLSIDGVKAHLRTLFTKFAIRDLRQNQKRARLVELAFQRGNLTRGDLESA